MSARVSELARLLRSGGQTDEQLAAVLHDAHECDIAAALELLDVRQRARLYRLLGAERLGDVFAYVRASTSASCRRSRPPISSRPWTPTTRLTRWKPSPPSCAAP